MGKSGQVVGSRMGKSGQVVGSRMGKSGQVVGSRMGNRMGKSGQVVGSRMGKSGQVVGSRMGKSGQVVVGSRMGKSGQVVGSRMGKSGQVVGSRMGKSGQVVDLLIFREIAAIRGIAATDLRASLLRSEVLFRQTNTNVDGKDSSLNKSYNKSPLPLDRKAHLHKKQLTDTNTDEDQDQDETTFTTTSKTTSKTTSTFKSTSTSTSTFKTTFTPTFTTSKKASSVFSTITDDEGKLTTSVAVITQVEDLLVLENGNTVLGSATIDGNVVISALNENSQVYSLTISSPSSTLNKSSAIHSSSFSLFAVFLAFLIPLFCI
ncbi:hypothetical protein BB561_000156 [Smittium simulii]|uniref:Uncharacterized protein n=1 Tax=Smittium simulii TaxID=133385 RepID=A0A2T9Z093_9FUNG|nr:hypothetical protein BB561_000156 [Smittium simulii]